MSDDVSSDAKNTNDDKSPVSAKAGLESMPKEELVKLVKNQIVLKKKLETKLNEYNLANVQLCQTEEQLRNELEDTQLKSTNLIHELEQAKKNESKLQQELITTRESLECFRLQSETLKTTCKSLQEETSNLQSELSTVRSLLTNIEHDQSRKLIESQNQIEYLVGEKQMLEQSRTLLHRFLSTTIDKLQIGNDDLTVRLSQTIDETFYDLYNNELQRKQYDWSQNELLYNNLKETYENEKQNMENLRQRLEDFEFANEELQSELEDLRSKSSKFEKDRHAMQTEIDDYRRQIEDFEEQFLEVQRESKIVRNTVDKSQQPSAASSMMRLDVTEEPISQDEQLPISKASSTSSLLLSSDIPTLLHSVGITNCTDEFSVPLDFESVLRLCTLLVERCRVLQYILLKNNDSSTVDNELVLSTAHIDGNEQCQVSIQRHCYSALDDLFERLHTWTNESIEKDNAEDWQLTIARPIDPNSNSVRFELNKLKFVCEHELIRIRHQLDQLSNENDEQRREISILEKRLHSTVDYEQLKERQTLLEQQFIEQCEKTIAFENLLHQEHIDKNKLMELKQIELSYHELEEKYLVAERLEEQLRQLQIEYNSLQECLTGKESQLLEQRQTFDAIKIECDRQRLNVRERDENLRMLSIDLEQHKSELHIIKNELEQQKQTSERQSHDNLRNADERYSFVLKQQQQLSDLLETKTIEAKNLSDKNRELENDLSNNKQLLFEQTKMADDLDRRLQMIHLEYDEYKTKYDQLKCEQEKLLDDYNLLNEKFHSQTTEQSEAMRVIQGLKHELEASKINLEKEKQMLNESIRQENLQLERKFIESQQTIDDLKNELESNKIDINRLQVQYDEAMANNIRMELENSKLNETIEDLNRKLQSQTATEPGESVQELKEKYNKMKLLLTRLKRELQEKNQQPKQSLIDLELADYEKTIKYHKEELACKEKEINDLRDELTANIEKYTCLKIEIDNLEQQKAQTDERANKFKALLDAAKKELQNAKDLEQERHNNDDNVRFLLENLQTELDNSKVSISELLNEKQQLTERMNSQSDVSQRAINMLEQNLRIAKHDLDIAKQDYDTLQDDFNSYKIRAQSVLKQHQNQSNQRERTPSMADKQIELEEIIEKLKTALRETNDKLQVIMTENDVLQKEQDRLVDRQNKLTSEARKREQDLRKQHQIELDKLEKECLQRTNDSHDMMKNVTLQNETLSVAFKEQIAAIEADHERSISILQNQLQSSRQEIEQLKIRLESLRQTTAESETSTTSPIPSQTGIINNESNRDDPAWTSSERQQGEGSESGSTDQQSADVAVKTLENVLFGSAIQNGAPSTPSSANLADKPRHILFEDVEIERQRVQEELNRTKLRLLNTTELLNESELNNVRLEEQVNLLKDEIRRIERNMDRAESIANLEYLKNIIFKFFVLKSTPERLQLIPVLVTMLKLSPDEQAQLVRVAHMTLPIGEASAEAGTSSQQQQQQLPNGTNAPSWGSYLNIW